MGGHVFNNVSSIKKERIDNTLKHMGEEFGRIFNSAIGEQVINATRLGSTGKKEVSGDIDLALDNRILTVMSWVYDESIYRVLIEQYQKRSRTATYNQLRKRALITMISQYINEHSEILRATEKGASNGTLFCTVPQYENDVFMDSYVQVDINFGSVDWLKFAYKSFGSEDPTIKGLHRTQLMIALFTYKGYTFSHNYGVKNKETQEIVANTPSDAIALLNKEYGLNFTEGDFNDYSGLMHFLMSNLDLGDLAKIFDIYLKVLDSTRCDIPSDLQWYWLENKKRLDLKGKFLPEGSALKK